LQSATGDRDQMLSAVANARNQLADLQQQSDAAAKTLADLQAKIQASQAAAEAAKPQ
jgi:hypothetical protein